MAVISGKETRTRRAILAGALGGIGALIGRSLGGPATADAASAVQLGVANTATSITAVRNTSGAATAVGFVGRSVSAGAVGLQGVAEGKDGKGVYGTAATGTGAMGVYGTASQGHGVQGYGVIGVVGSGATWGVYGTTGATSGIAVNAIATGSNGIGVMATSPYYGVYVKGAPNTAFYNEPSAMTGVYAQGTQIAGDFNGGTWGVYAQGTTYGVYGSASGSGTYGVYCEGDMKVTGTINPAAAVLQIDHPQAPERKWLSQSLVSSGEALNVQSGTVTLGANGQATVQLPSYFSALTETADLRYQLTPIGAQFTPYVAQEVERDRFRIAGGVSGQKVSWQVSGVRRDDYATAHPLRVETRKSKAEIGTRQFVPEGSHAKQMDTRPPHGPRPARPGAAPAR